MSVILRQKRAFRRRQLPIGPMRARCFLASSLVAVSALALAPGARAESFHEAIQLAWDRDPANQSFSVDATASHKNARAAQSWFPDGPIVAGQYLDDHFIGTNLGYTTYQGSISVPLWLPGQGTATVRNALADEAVAKARIKVQHLLSAVRILDLASAATLLEKKIGNLRATSDLLERVVQSSHQGLRAGEIAAADFDAVVGEKGDFDAQIAQSEQALENNRAELEALTGTDEIPDILSLDGRILGTQNLTLDPTRDPRIEMAAAVSRSAKAAYSLARHSYMPNPQLGVQVVKQGQYGSPWDTQVGVQFSMALPSEARNTPMVMKEVKAMGAAERDAILAQRKVKTEYRQTRASLSSALAMLRNASSARQALDARAHDLEHAWSVGETPVIEYLRARRAALEAGQRNAEADVIWHAAMIRMSLMAGNYP
ncbi:TolC family protein [Asaia sp. As-1742]|uniref:TolC family protein n=1 Tax=Asaia sp. As-1742 TaxID=2608325 RepID=UPI00141FAB24|nr:TolC family protein [Asaia sp. As-1742]NIE80005.1 TolC family protein [Asaia sp. As-1742]